MIIHHSSSFRLGVGRLGRGGGLLHKKIWVTVMTAEIQTKIGQNLGVEFLIVSGLVPRVEPLTVKNPDWQNPRCHKTSIFSHQKIARR